MEIRVEVIGLEVMEGVGKTSKKAYSMGRVHTMTKLAPPAPDTENIATGCMGDTYEADAAFIRKVAHLPCPFVAVLEVDQQMRFGERKLIVTGIKPVEAPRKAA